MTTTEVKPITYPARPHNGGPLDKAFKKTGGWCWEPKVNGWRTLIHVPTGTMFNRHGGKLSIAHEYTEAIKELQQAHSHIEWLDCEALGRRHNVNRGALMILDAVLPGTFLERKEVLVKADEQYDSHKCYLIELGHGNGYANNRWKFLQEENKRLGCDYYEGLVAKQEDSLYPIQLASPKKEFSFWVKHRWAY